MSLQNLSLPALLGGIALLAGVLFLLQRLRVRYREHTVITTLFWKEALEEARARVLVRRFKHPWAYLFVLLLATLMWIGWADPRTSLAGRQEHVVLLDSSAGMARGQRFQECKDLVMQHVAGLAGKSVRVISCGERPTMLLQRGENPLLLAARLEELVPQACPASVDQVLRLLSRSLATEVETFIVVAGDARLSKASVAMLPASVHISSLSPGPLTTGRNHGITALGFSRSSSGSYEHVDVLCELASTVDDPVSLSTSIGGAPVKLEARQSREGSITRVVLIDVPANGELLTVKLLGSTAPGFDDLSLDDVAQMRLPLRRRIRVAMDKDLAATVGAVLRVDPAVLVVVERPDVRIAVGDAAGSATIPTLSFVPSELQEEAILIYHEQQEASEQVLMASFAQLGLSEVDAMDVAQKSGKKIAIGAAPGRTRGIGVWSALLTERFNFIQSRSFPLFIARALRWLAQVEDEPQFVAAGEDLAVDAQSVLTDASGRRFAPVGAAFHVPMAGLYRDDGGRVVAAALADRSSTLGANAAASVGQEMASLAPASTTGAGLGNLDLAFWLAAGVFLLLLIEWFLHGTGRMP